MSSSSSNELSLFPTDLDALRDYWVVHERFQDEIDGQVRDAARRDPALTGLFDETPERARLVSREARNERMAKALGGDWTDYVNALRTHGASDAERGLPFQSWSRLVQTRRRAVVTRLIDTYRDEPDRLAAALNALHDITDGSVAVVSEVYLGAQRRLVEEQRSIAEAGARDLAVSEQNLRRRTAILEAVIDAMRDGVLLCSPSREFLVVNTPGREVLERNAEPRPTDVWHPTRDGVFKGDGTTQMTREEMPLSRAIAGEAAQDIEMVIEGRRFPQPRRFLCDTRPVFVDGQLIGGLTVMRDVTERTRMLEMERRGEELERQNVLVQEASRLKSEFLANMSHELRTPLNAIIGFSELIFDEIPGPLNRQQHDYLGDVLTSSRHLLQLINDVLDLAKVEAGRIEMHPEEIDLRVVAREVVAVLRTTAGGKNVTIDVESEGAPESVCLDAARVKQILYNYLSNALKFSPEGGHVLLRIRSEEPDTVRIEVSDEGPGIDKADQSRLFREFEQIWSASHPGGTGLGLALSRRLAEAMGGSVGVQSVVGQGSTFHARLPRRSGLGAQDTSSSSGSGRG